IRDKLVTGVQTCALPIWPGLRAPPRWPATARRRAGTRRNFFASARTRIRTARSCRRPADACDEGASGGGAGGERSAVLLLARSRSEERRGGEERGGGGAA